MIFLLTILTMIAQGPQVQLRGGMARLWQCQAQEVLLEGPAGTGKTIGALEKIRFVAEEYPGSNCIIARKVLATMATSTLKTWEDEVLGSGHPAYDKLSRVGRTRPYRFPNGSLVQPMGFDDPEKLKSSQWNFIYVNEATELEIADCNMAMSRLRGKGTPYNQLILDCNPGAPIHWLNHRPNDPLLDHLGKPVVDEHGKPVPKMERIITRHCENPWLWDISGRRWTEAGRQYMAKLWAMTGVDRKRLLFGQWCAAEGAVFENEWDEARHIIKDVPRYGDGTPAIRYTLVAIDWGYTNPGCAMVLGVDGDRRLYRVREVYWSGKDYEWWAHQLKCLKRDYKPTVMVADPEDAASIEYMTKKVGVITKAEKSPGSVKAGIQALRDLMKNGPDGRPRLLLVANANGCYQEDGTWIYDSDPVLVEAHHPLCTEQEMQVYAYPKGVDGKVNKEVPVDNYNHGIDALRYGRDAAWRRKTEQLGDTPLTVVKHPAMR